MTWFARVGFRRTVARLLLALFALPTGPALGMGMVDADDLGFVVAEPAPQFGATVELSERTTALAEAHRAARRIAQRARPGVVAARSTLAALDRSLRRARPAVAPLARRGRVAAAIGLDLAAERALVRPGFSSFATTEGGGSSRHGSEGDPDTLPLTDLPAPPTPPDAVPTALPPGAAARSGRATPATVPPTHLEPSVAVPVVPAFSLLSISWQPNDPSPGAVFLPVASAVRRVFAFDACDPGDPWKLWDPADPGGSDLTAITPSKGFWLEGVAEATIPEGGPEPVTTSIPLCPGWNLIGFPSSSPRPVGAALASIAGSYLRVFGFDPNDSDDPWEVFDVAVPAWANDLTELRPGRGYWIYVTAATTLEVSNQDDLPTAAIDSPDDLAEITGPVPVVGTVRSPTLASWRLSYRAVGDADWVDLGIGSAPVEAAPLGELDPTLLENGLYELRLVAIDGAGRVAESSIAISIAGTTSEASNGFTT